MKHHWPLDPAVTFLNHGSYGATPHVVLEAQSRFRERMEREPVRFFNRELEPLLDAARATLGTFLNADPDNLAFVPNATAGVNAVLRSLDLDKFDELVVTTHEYNASRNALEYVAGLVGAKVVVVEIPFPIEGPETVIARVMERITERTRLVLVDHVTSPTALIFPIRQLVERLRERGVDTLVDGAHAPGFLPLDLRAIDAAYYTGNLHKWVCAPKGAAFLYVRKSKRASIRPVAISHGASSPREDRSRFLLEFDWTGTFDPTAWLSVPKAIELVGSLVDGGWPEVMRRNRALALEGAAIVGRGIGAPEEMLGAMVSILLPDGEGDPLQDALLFEEGIEVPIVPWPAPPKRLVRISAHLHNERGDYERLANALQSRLQEVSQ